MATKSKKYDWTQFTEKIEIRATPARVFKAWTSEQRDRQMVHLESDLLNRRKGGKFFMQFVTGVFRR